MINIRVIIEFSRMGIDPKAPIVISRNGDNIDSTIYAVEGNKFFNRNFDAITEEEYNKRIKRMTSKKKEVTISLDSY